MTITGRNDPCPCGSGKKFKKCCLTSQRDADFQRRRFLQVEAALIPRLLSHASDRFGVDAIMEAWDEFSDCETDEGFDPESPLNMVFIESQLAAAAAAAAGAGGTTSESGKAASQWFDDQSHPRDDQSHPREASGRNDSTPWSALARQRFGPPPKKDPLVENPFLSLANAPPELRAAMEEMNRRHWAAWFDIPIPALNDMTPRELPRISDTLKNKWYPSIGDCWKPNLS